MSDEKKENLETDLQFEDMLVERFPSGEERTEAMMKRLMAYYEALNGVKTYKIVIEELKNGKYHAECPALPGCAEDGDTAEEALRKVREKRDKWAVTAIGVGKPIPEEEQQGEFSGQIKIRIPKSLHRSLSVHAEQEGTSLNQYIVYLLSGCDSLWNSQYDRLKRYEEELEKLQKGESKVSEADPDEGK